MSGNPGHIYMWTHIRNRLTGLVEKPGFEAVRQAFVDNFTNRDELGAACSIYHHGEKVVDLWGGIRNKTTAEPWEEDTMVFVASTTKGMAGLAVALAHSRGWLDYEELVCTYWPEFAQKGKEKVEAMVKVETAASKFASTSVRYADQNGKMKLSRKALLPNPNEQKSEEPETKS